MTAITFQRDGCHSASALARFMVAEAVNFMSITTSGKHGRTTRSLIVAGVLLALSSVQYSRGATACLELVNALDPCRCCRVADLSHVRDSAAPGTASRSARVIKYTDGDDAKRGGTCCTVAAQSERPAAVVSLQDTPVEIESSPYIIRVTPMHRHSTNIHAPPHNRPLYLTTSRLLI